MGAGKNGFPGRTDVFGREFARAVFIRGDETFFKQPIHKLSGAGRDHFPIGWIMAGEMLPNFRYGQSG